MIDCVDSVSKINIASNVLLLRKIVKVMDYLFVIIDEIMLIVCLAN